MQNLFQNRERNKIKSRRRKSAKNNSKKRKLDKHDINNKNKRNRKKRKINENEHMNSKLNELIESNKLLKKQNHELTHENNRLTNQRKQSKEGLNDCRREVDKWKSKYLKLHSKLCILTNSNTHKINNNTNTNNEFISNSNVLDDYAPTNRNKTKKKLNISRKKRKKNKKSKNRNKSMPNNNIIHNTLNSNKSRVINVINPNNVRSNNISSNNANIETNEKNINAKYSLITDRLLEMGFDKTDVINKISSYNGSGEQPEFVFNQLINTLIPNTWTQSQKLRSNTKSKETKSVTKNKAPRNWMLHFDDSYDISVHCHICKQHLSDMYEYKDHLKQHYDNDENRTWLYCDCDFDCDTISTDFTKFVGHITTHTKDKPYKCNVTINGIRCEHSAGYKWDIKRHWQSHVKKKQKLNETKQFENSYHVSVHCHICQKHFDNINTYTLHLRKHYETDTNRNWKECDFGCKKPLYKDEACFISHISTHTKDKPFNCAVNNCKSSYGSKHNLRQHWKLHLKKQKYKHNNHNKSPEKTINIDGNMYTYETSNDENSTSASDNYSSTTSDPPESESDTETESEIESDDIIVTEFEKSYYVSVDCHICHAHFDDFAQYRFHIKKHYDMNTNREWLVCDFGCKDSIDTSQPQKLKDASGFLYHIASHTKKLAFKCKVMVCGEICQHASGAKSNLKRHWNSMHNKKKYGKVNEYNNCSSHS